MRRARLWYPRVVERDGNGWVQCALGHPHWGRHGAAGLLLHTVDDGGVVRVLLQHRAAWSHHGGTWGLPGGARDSHEDVVAAALREAEEEAGIDAAAVRIRHVHVDDHGGWSYTTVLADTRQPLVVTPERENVALAWVALDDVDGRSLHPGFAATWPVLRAEPLTVLVDTANVVGSRPDGWWRDRAGATTLLLQGLTALRGATVSGPDRRVVVRAVVAVLEGEASAAAAPPWIEVVRTPRHVGASGDDALVEACAEALSTGEVVVAVTADRGLRSRLDQVAAASPGTLHVVGPRWVLGRIGRDAAGAPH